MSNNDGNRSRAFTEVVSIDAWHEPFSHGNATADLHADVVFSTGRLGAEKESQVRFRLSIKRAELVVIVPDVEPLTIDKTSVARSRPDTTTRTTVTTFKTKSELSGEVKLGASSTAITASAGVDAKAGVHKEHVEKLESTERLATVRITHRFDNNDKSHHWNFTPSNSITLAGAVWDAKTESLLKLVDTRRDRNKGLPPAVRLQIRCLREDLDIIDIEIKDEGLWKKVQDRIGSRNRSKAAEAYIRNQLEAAGLASEDLSEKFAKITLADVFANN